MMPMFARFLAVVVLLISATQTQAQNLDYPSLAKAAAGHCADFLEGGSPQDAIVSMGIPLRKARKHLWQYRIQTKSPNQRFDLTLSHKKSDRAAAQCSLTALFANEEVATAYVDAVLSAFSNKGYSAHSARGLLVQIGDKILTKGPITVEMSATYTFQGGVIKTQFIRKK